jgi:hypothetical protein
VPSTKARYIHQPDFALVEITKRPDNTQPTEPLILTGPCVCGEPAHYWTYTVTQAQWRPGGTRDQLTRILLENGPQ